MSKVQRLIDLVDTKLAEVPEPNWQDAKHSRQRRFKLETIVHEIGQEEAGPYRFNATGSVYTLRIAGVSTSCTSGIVQLLRNWQNAARRHLKKAEAAR